MNDLWRPACPCDARCLHTTAPQVCGPRAAARALAALGVLLFAVVAIPFAELASRRRAVTTSLGPRGVGDAGADHPTRLPPQASAARAASGSGAASSPGGHVASGSVGRWVARGILRAMGIRWSVVGAGVQPGALLVGNHVSWLDVVVMMAAGHERLRMLSKIEVSGWPVIGKLARASRTIFVDRARPRQLPATVAEVTEALRGGDAVQVFPEGTTTCGAHPARWRCAFLQAALDAGAPVQRFTLLFSTQRAAFVDDETLVTSLVRVLRLRGLSVTVLVDEAQQVGAANRRELAARLSPSRRSARVLL